MLRSHWVSLDAPAFFIAPPRDDVVVQQADFDSSGPAGHTAAIYAARADLKRTWNTSLGRIRH
jgi:hypothetical protein